MTQDEKRLWLIRYLLGENVHYRNTRILEDISEQKDMLRALMNVRMPMPVTEEFLEIQDSYLQTENESMGYVSMTQQEFSDLISVTRSRLSAWESECTGFHPNEESFNKIKDLAVGIGIDFNRLMDNPAEYRDEYNIFVESNWGLKIKQIRLREHDNISLIRLNIEQAVVPESFGRRTVGINADMAESIRDIVEEVKRK